MYKYHITVNPHWPYKYAMKKYHSCYIWYCITNFLHIRLLKVGTEAGVEWWILYHSIIVIIQAAIRSWISINTTFFTSGVENREFSDRLSQLNPLRIIKQMNYTVLFNTVWTPFIQPTKSNWKMKMCQRWIIWHYSLYMTLLKSRLSE